MRLFQQQRKPPVLQAFHSMVLMHLLNPPHSVGASPTASREPCAVPPGSASVRDADAAAAGREVLERQIVGGLWASLQGLPSYSPAFASLQYTEGRRVVA